MLSNYSFKRAACSRLSILLQKTCPLEVLKLWLPMLPHLRSYVQICTFSEATQYKNRKILGLEAVVAAHKKHIFKTMKFEEKVNSKKKEGKDNLLLLLLLLYIICHPKIERSVKPYRPLPFNLDI